MKVISGLKLSLLYILLINGWNLVKCNENNNDKQNKKRKAIELDIRKTKTTNEFYYHEDNERNFGFYVAKDNFVFQGVKRSGSFSSGVWFKQHIWTSKDQEEDANIIIVNGVRKNNVTVTILHNNGKSKEFNKSGFFKKFEEKKLNLVNHQNKNVKIIISNDYKEENNNQIGHILFKNSNGDPNLNVIRDGVKCIEVKYNEVSAWKYDEKSTQGYPRALYYMPNRFLLFFNELFQIYNYLGDSCELLYNSKVEPYMLSMDDDPTSSHYDYYNNGTDTVAFIAKEGHVFNELKFLRSWVHSIRLDRNVWKSNNLAQYATKVVMKRYPTKVFFNRNCFFKKMINVYLATGEKIVYHRLSWGFRWRVKGNSKFLVRSLITEKTEFPYGLKVITRYSDNSNVKMLKENDTSKFKLYRYHSDDLTHFYMFDFNEGAECVGIQFNDMTIWNYDEKSKAGYPKSITYTKRRISKVFRVFFSDELQYLYKCNGTLMDMMFSRSLRRNNNSKVKFVSSTNSSSSVFDQKQLVVVTLNDNVTYSENDTSKYTLKTTGSFNNHLEYEFKSGGFCVAVKYGEEVVWATDPGNNTVFPKKVKVYPDNKTLWVVFDDYNFATFHFKETGRWEFVRDVSFGTAAEYKHPTTGPFAVEPTKPEDSSTPVVPVTPTGGDQKPSVPEEEPKPVEDVLPVTPKPEEEQEPVVPSEDSTPLTEEQERPVVPVIPLEPLQPVVPEETTPAAPVEPEDTKPVEDTFSQHPDYKYTVNYPKLYTTKSDGTLEELNDDSYISKYDRVFKILYYKLKDDVKCTEVQYGEHLVWTHDKNELGEEYPVALYFHRDILQVVVQFKEFYLVYKYKDDKFDFVLKNDNIDFSKNDLKIFTLDRTDKTKGNENDVSEYEIVSYYFVTRVFFMSGSMCSEVRYKDKFIWKNNYLTKGFYPKVVSYSITKRFFIDFDLDWYYVYKYDRESDKFVLEIEETPEERGELLEPVVPFTPVVPEEPTPVTPKPSGEEPLQPVLPTKPSVPEEPVEDFKDALEELVKELDDEQKPPRQTADKNVKLITLEDDNDLRVNDTTKYKVDRLEYDYELVYRFELKDGVKLVAVYLAEYGFTMKKKLIWVHDPEVHGNRYPTKVYYNFTYKAVEVVLDDDWHYGYAYDKNTQTFELRSKMVRTQNNIPKPEDRQPEKPLQPVEPVIPLEALQPVDTTPLTEDQVKEMFKDLVKNEFGVTDEDVLEGYLLLLESSFRKQGYGLSTIDLRKPYLRELVSDIVQKEFNLERVEDQKPVDDSTPSTPIKSFKGSLEELVKYLDAEPTPVGQTADKNVKLITLEDENDLKVNDTTKYKLDRLEYDYQQYVYRFELKDGVKLVAVYFDQDVFVVNEKLVWVHDKAEHSNNYPKKIYYNYGHRSIEVVFDDEWHYGYAYDKNTQTFKLRSKMVRTQNNIPKPEDRQPEKPLQPVEPVTPLEPLQPVEPTTPSVPEDTTPAAPVEDTKPVEDVVPESPAVPEGPEQPAEPFEEPTPSGPVVLELDVSKKETTDEYEYSKEGKVHTWTAKEGYEFSKVKKGNDVLLESKDLVNFSKVTLDLTNPKNASLEVEYVSKSVSVEFDGFEEEEHEEPLQPVVPTKPDRDSDVSGLPRYQYMSNYPKLYTTKSDGTSEELNRNLYYSKDDDELNLLYYKLKDGVKCTEVKYNDVSVWKYDPDGDYKGYPVALYFHRDILQVAVQFKEFYLVYKYKDDKFEFVLRNDNSDFSKDDLKIFTFDRTDTTKVNENDDSEYKIISYYFVTRVFFREGAMCSEVRYKDKFIWKNNYLVKGFYPKMVSYSITKRFFIDFDLDWYYVYKYDQDTDKFVLEKKEETSKPWL